MLKSLLTFSLLVGLVIAKTYEANHWDGTGRIVGGKPTTIEKYPWQLSFQFKGRHNCGASIISSKWALTAAHCSVPENFPQQFLSFRAGSTYHDRGGTIHNVSRIIVPSNYSTQNLDVDIALVEVTNPFNLNSGQLSAVKLPADGSSPKPGTISQTTGWGNLNETQPGPLQLHEVDSPIVSKEDCKKSYGKDITVNMLCAGYPQGGKGSCRGDSGGPLVVNNVIYGVVSWAKGCARPNYPSVYAHVGVLRSWIRKHSGV